MLQIHFFYRAGELAEDPLHLVVDNSFDISWFLPVCLWRQAPSGSQEGRFCLAENLDQPSDGLIFRDQALGFPLDPKLFLVRTRDFVPSAGIDLGLLALWCLWGSDFIEPKGHGLASNQLSAPNLCRGKPRKSPLSYRLS